MFPLAGGWDHEQTVERCSDYGKGVLVGGNDSLWVYLGSVFLGLEPLLFLPLKTIILSSFLHKASHDALTHSGQETLYPVDHRWSLLKLRVI